MSHRLCERGPPSSIPLSESLMGCSCWCSPRQPVFPPSWQSHMPTEREGGLHFWGLLAGIWLGLPDPSDGVQDSSFKGATATQWQEGVGSSGNTSLLLLAHAVISCILFPETHAHKAAAVPSSLFLLVGTFLSLALDSFLFCWCLVCIPAAPCYLPACLGRVWRGCLDASAVVHECKQPCLEAWCQHPWKAHSFLQSKVLLGLLLGLSLWWVFCFVVPVGGTVAMLDLFHEIKYWWGWGNSGAFILDLKSLGWNMTWSQSALSSVYLWSHPSLMWLSEGLWKRHCILSKALKTNKANRSSVLFTWKT